MSDARDQLLGSPAEEGKHLEAAVLGELAVFTPTSVREQVPEQTGRAVGWAQVKVLYDQHLQELITLYSIYHNYRPTRMYNYLKK